MTHTAECEFCRAYRSYTTLGGLHTKDDPPLLQECTVALVVRSWTKEKGKRNAGRITDYRNQGIGYTLNYCPECGRKIKQ